MVKRVSSAGPRIVRSASGHSSDRRRGDASPSRNTVPIHIPVVLRVKNERKDIPGVTRSMSLQRIRFLTDQVFNSGFPLALQFRIGNGICYLNAAGQVISCIPAGTGTGAKYLIEVQFIALREFELRMLESALEEMSHHLSARQDSLLTIHGTRDTLAEEATRLVEQAPRQHPIIKKHPVEETISERPWILELKRRTQPYWEAILACRLVQEGSRGTLSMERMKGWILQLYRFIETFPKWIALSIVKTSDQETRGFLIDNVRVEKKHAAQWVQMALGFGVDKTELYSVEPLPAVDALTRGRWSINTQGTLAEAVSATNYAIEGVTQGIAKLGLEGLPHYAGMPGISLDKKALAWMKNHAKYDEMCILYKRLRSWRRIPRRI